MGITPDELRVSTTLRGEPLSMVLPKAAVLEGPHGIGKSTVIRSVCLALCKAAPDVGVRALVKGTSLLKALTPGEVHVTLDDGRTFSYPDNEKVSLPLLDVRHMVTILRASKEPTKLAAYAFCAPAPPSVKAIKLKRSKQRTMLRNLEAMVYIRDHLPSELSLSGDLLGVIQRERFALKAIEARETEALQAWQDSILESDELTAFQEAVSTTFNRIADQAGLGLTHLSWSGLELSLPGPPSGGELVAIGCALEWARRTKFDGDLIQAVTVLPDLQLSESLISAIADYAPSWTILLAQRVSSHPRLHVHDPRSS